MTRVSPVWLLLLGLIGCRQEMAAEGRLKPFAASSVFADGMAARPLIPGTVARGRPRLTTPYYTGVTAGHATEELPLPLTRALLDRGRERYDIYCAACHDRAGTGRGIVVQRGFPAPPSLHLARLRRAPIGHFFAVTGRGSGRMFGFAASVDVPDRWAIAAYIRALQLSQHAAVGDAPADQARLLTGAAS